MRELLQAADQRNPAIGAEKLAIDQRNPAIEPQKLAIGELKLAVKKMNYIASTQKKIINVYEAIDVNQIFGVNDIAAILNCSASAAREVMSKLRTMQVVCKVKGHGKGRYRFVNENERETE